MADKGWIEPPPNRYADILASRLLNEIEGWLSQRGRRDDYRAVVQLHQLIHKVCVEHLAAMDEERTYLLKRLTDKVALEMPPFVWPRIPSEGESNATKQPGVCPTEPTS